MNFREKLKLNKKLSYSTDFIIERNEFTVVRENLIRELKAFTCPENINKFVHQPCKLKTPKNDVDHCKNEILSLETAINEITFPFTVNFLPDSGPRELASKTATVVGKLPVEKVKCVTETSNLIEIPTRLPIPVFYISILNSFKLNSLKEVINYCKKYKLKWITNLRRFTASNGEVLNPGKLMELPKTTFRNRDQDYIDVITHPELENYRINLDTLGDFRICRTPDYSKTLPLIEIMAEETIPFLVTFPDTSKFKKIPKEFEAISNQRLLVIKSSKLDLAIAAVERANSYEFHSFSVKNVLIQLQEFQQNISLNEDEMEAAKYIVFRNKMAEHKHLKFTYNEVKFFKQFNKNNNLQVNDKIKKKTLCEKNSIKHSFPNSSMRTKGCASLIEMRNKFSSIFNESDQSRSRTRSVDSKLKNRVLAQQTLSLDYTRISSFTNDITFENLGISEIPETKHKKSIEGSFETVYDVPNMSFPNKFYKSFKKVIDVSNDSFSSETPYTFMSPCFDNNAYNSYLHEYSEIPQKLLH
ncbi:uncharacterized protein LOC124813346 isoform X1 [Hydra vulgaris]|uniref:uncharacterized protein LOC124813346 isoform X1 n=1 Tax=Hydra vulgaris TaxID=6087 RepID=UPI001F5E4F22|nr:uncharacterized protein LOC124813346 [Hydra vulgaris]